MKNQVKILALVLAAAMLCTILVSCGNTLSGTYSVGGDIAGASYKFSGNKVTVTYKIVGVSKSFSGTYKIDGDKITFTFEDKDVDSKYTGEKSFAKGTNADGKKYVTIGGVEYTKAD